MNGKLKEFVEKIEADEVLNARFEDICLLQNVREVRVRTLELAHEIGVDLQETDLVPMGTLDETDLEKVWGGRGFWDVKLRALAFA